MPKKYLPVLLFTCTISVCNAQSFVVGITGQAKSTWLLNSAVMAATTKQEAKMSFGFSGGATMAIYFKQHVGAYWGIGLDAIIGNHSQRYSGSITGTTSYSVYDSKINLTCLDVPVYAKIVLHNGTFVEAGMQFSLLVNANYKSTGGVETTSTVTPQFSPYYYAPMIGIGGDFEVQSDVYVFVGLRVLYGISDLKGVDGQGNDISTQPDYAGSATNALALVLNLGAYYRFDVGKYGKVGKHRR